MAPIVFQSKRRAIDLEKEESIECRAFCKIGSALPIAIADVNSAKNAMVNLALFKTMLFEIRFARNTPTTFEIVGFR